MQLGISGTVSAVYVHCADMFYLRFAHKNTVNSQPLRVVDYCG